MVGRCSGESIQGTPAEMPRSVRRGAQAHLRASMRRRLQRPGAVAAGVATEANPPRLGPAQAGLRATRRPRKEVARRRFGNDILSGAMATHVKVLGIIHIAFGSLGILGALALLMIFGGIAGIVGASGEEGAHIAVPILGGIGALLFFFLVLVSLPGIVAGIGLLGFRPWARILTIVLSAIHLINVPFGTAVGVYGLWALLNRETEDLFARPYVAA
jgi:hypothetical protein